MTTDEDFIDQCAAVLMTHWGVDASDEGAYDMACADVHVLLESGLLSRTDADVTRMRTALERIERGGMNDQRGCAPRPVWIRDIAREALA